MSPSDSAGGSTGRATDPQFAQNPIPVLQAMGRALAEWHSSAPDPDLAPRTRDEVAAAQRALDVGAAPHPYTRVSVDALREALHQAPPATASVPTHGAPVVGSVVLHEGVARFEDSDCGGFDPPERDLAIALRSIAETFAGEATVAFLDAYEEAGGAAPSPVLLDWYAVVAAFR